MKRWMLLLLFFAGCKGFGPPEVTWTEGYPDPPPDLSGAAQVFAARCSPCHGPEGRGDGVAAAALNPRPQNLRDPSWRARVTDAEMTRAIREGGEAVHRSALMPGNPDMSQEEVARLVALIRSW